ncbi:UvrD-helicase domain-containing protein [bacterium]|nr:UvrD-helicase domain-containing protein [bacterium]
MADSKQIQLNGKQLEAVSCLKGPLLILAGAGSGKTRVLTHRIINLIQEGVAMPGEILALTFTNKAAGEMRERVRRQLAEPGMPVDQIWLSTFHSMGAKLLREHAHLVGLDSSFSIFDSADQKTVVKTVMQEVGISDKVVSPKAVAWKLDSLKNDGINPKNFEGSQSFMDKKLVPIVKRYQEKLKENNAVDFGDLLLLTFELFHKNPELCDEFQDRYPFILVDEYQDTNAIQYKILKLITAKYRNLCVVGDEDQSIYKWRGADISNILNFEKDFPETKVIKLEENYRSTKNIISAASTVIANNTQRKEKTLFTSNPDGDPIEIHILQSDFEESQWVVESIRKKVQLEGVPLNDVAIFYRTHAQSRLLEDRLRYNRLHYKIFGGLKFYDRAEVKDVLAYMRLMVNPKDDVSLFRIINVPTRGIGKTSLIKIKTFALEKNIAGLEAIGEICSMPPTPEFKGAARSKLQGFLKLYQELLAASEEQNAEDFYSFLLEKTGYLDKLKDEDTIEAQTRIENLKELASALSEYAARTAQSGLREFLEEVALLSDLDKEQENQENYVTMMTLHSAKGLEYPYVYLVGLEEGLFPSIRDESFEDDEDIEEERRLCYVGMTRAMKKLHMTSARMRKVFGRTQIRRESRFIDEIPEQYRVLVDETRGRAPANSWQQNAGHMDDDSQYFNDPNPDGFESQVNDEPTEGGFPVGSKVAHPDFGAGVVVKRSGNSTNLKVSVRFNGFGVKKFIARFAPLEPLI